MGRLTYRHSENRKVVFANKGITDVLVKLADYEDAEEQGLLLRLPIPLGTTKLYIHDEDEVCELNARRIEVQKMYSGKIIFGIDCFDFYEEDFGKTVFLTREEAEQALAEMQK